MPIETRPVTLNSNQGVVLVRPATGGLDDDRTRVDLVLARGSKLNTRLQKKAPVSTIVRDVPPGRFFDIAANRQFG